MENQEALYAALASLFHHLEREYDSISEFVPADLQKQTGRIDREIIFLADRLAVGSKGGPVTKGERSRQPSLLSIFSLIKVKEGDEVLNAPGDRYLPMRRLSIQASKPIFPLSQAEISQVDSQQVKQELLNDLGDQLHRIKLVYERNASLDGYLENLLHLLQRYTWCMPTSHYPELRGVSQYDHSRMTAALAAVLSDSDLTKEELSKVIEVPEAGETGVALLIGGDISGVQDFIYTITNKGATSALRGRSFYLQLLTEAAARFVLREMGLPYTNLIYGGGGNFYILARASDEKKLPALRKKLGRILYRHHQGDLYVAIAGLPLKAGDFIRPAGVDEKHPLSEKWGELARRMAVVKNQRFSELDESELATLFTPQGHGGNLETQCLVCGREYKPGPNEKDEKKKGKCDACLSYEDLGRDLRDAQYIAWKLLDHPEQVAPIKADVRSGEWWKVLNNLGFNIHVKEKLADLSRDADLIWALSEDSFSKSQNTQTDRVLVRRLLVNVTPTLSEAFETDDGQYFEKDEIKPFEKLAKDSNGIIRLGVFRADVDNLGKLFAEGLGSDATLSCIASLSFAVSLFFEGWVGQIAEKRNKDNGDRLYAIYSGGDDLFFVGSWDELVEFARQVNEDLKKYTGGHPGIHVSSGMTLVTEKYPLAKAARDAETAEKAAKSMEWWDEQGKPHRKNVFSFLGQPVPWSEFEQAGKLKVRLEKLEDNQRTAVIRKLLMNYAMYAKVQRDRRNKGKDRKPTMNRPQTLYGPWNWRILYLLRRTFGKETPENQHTEEQRLARDFHVLPEQEKHPDFARLDWVGVAARWVELLDR